MNHPTRNWLWAPEIESNHVFIHGKPVRGDSRSNCVVERVTGELGCMQYVDGGGGEIPCPNALKPTALFENFTHKPTIAAHRASGGGKHTNKN